MLVHHFEKTLKLTRKPQSVINCYCCFLCLYKIWLIFDKVKVKDDETNGYIIYETRIIHFG